MLFSEFYNHYIMCESINDVPRKDLGMSTSILELPEDHVPYGFWVDRSGNFIEVKNKDHIGTLVRLVTNARRYLSNQDVEYNPKFLYSDLFNIGWCRVVMGNMYVMYEMGARQVATPSQIKFMNILMETYDKKGVVNDT